MFCAEHIKIWEILCIYEVIKNIFFYNILKGSSCFQNCLSYYLPMTNVLYIT